jgi:hypothetical protein
MTKEDWVTVVFWLGFIVIELAIILIFGPFDHTPYYAGML